MKTLYDFISIDNISYDKLNKRQKAKIDLFIRKLKEAGLEDKILAFVKGDYHYSFTDKEHFSTNLPDDLRKEIDKVYTHMND